MPSTTRQRGWKEAENSPECRQGACELSTHRAPACVPAVWGYGRVTALAIL